MGVETPGQVRPRLSACDGIANAERWADSRLARSLWREEPGRRAEAGRDDGPDKDQEAGHSEMTDEASAVSDAREPMPS